MGTQTNSLLGWHHHLQTAIGDADTPISDVIYTDVALLTLDFIGLAEFFDAEQVEILRDDADFQTVAIDRFYEAEVERVPLGIYCNFGQFTLRVFNCPGCLGRSMN